MRYRTFFVLNRNPASLVWSIDTMVDKMGRLNTTVLSHCRVNFAEYFCFKISLWYPGKILIKTYSALDTISTCQKRKIDCYVPGNHLSSLGCRLCLAPFMVSMETPDFYHGQSQWAKASDVGKRGGGVLVWNLPFLATEPLPINSPPPPLPYPNRSLETEFWLHHTWR